MQLQLHVGAGLGVVIKAKGPCSLQMGLPVGSGGGSRSLSLPVRAPCALRAPAAPLTDQTQLLHVPALVQSPLAVPCPVHHQSPAQLTPEPGLRMVQEAERTPLPLRSQAQLAGWGV